MICDECIDCEECRTRKFLGKHMSECKSFFPDWTIDRTIDRSPKAPMTPESRRRPMETREA